MRCFINLKIMMNLLFMHQKAVKSIPKIPFKNIKVVLKDLKTGDDIRNISKNYKKYKLEKIGVRM
jgi:hypothetical protein